MKTREEIKELLERAQRKEYGAVDEIHQLNFEERKILWELATE